MGILQDLEKIIIIIKSDTHTYEVLKEENHKEGKT
jgi:hypothetical protein